MSAMAGCTSQSDSPVPYRGNTKRQVLPAAVDICILCGRGPASQVMQAPLCRFLTASQTESGLFHHASKAGLGGEPLNRLHQILVRISITGEDLAARGDHSEGVLAVEPRRGRQ